MGDSNVYTAERIISKRKYRGVTQYYIKWKGYSLKESTWEPIENIFDPGLIEAFETGRSYKAASASLANTLNYSSSSSSASASASTSTSTSAGGSRSSANSSSLESQSSPTASSSSSKRSNDNSTSSVAKRGRGRPRKVSYSQQREEQVRIQRNIEQQQLDKARQTTTTSITNSTPSKTMTTTTTQTARSEVSRTIAPSAEPEHRATKATANSSATNTSNAASNTGDKQHLVIFNPQGRQAEQAVLEQIVYQPELTKSICVTDVTYKDVTVVISESSSAEGFFKT